MILKLRILINWWVIKKSLGDKVSVLDNLNKRVLQQLPDDKVEDEIVISSEINDDINEMIYAIDYKLKINSTARTISKLSNHYFKIWSQLDAFIFPKQW